MHQVKESSPEVVHEDVEDQRSQDEDDEVEGMASAKVVEKGAQDTQNVQKQD